eukprot:6846602-Prymnesium_polylepis.1
MRPARAPGRAGVTCTTYGSPGEARRLYYCYNTIPLTLADYKANGEPDANEKGEADAPPGFGGEAACVAAPSPAERCSEAMRRATPDEPDHGCAVAPSSDAACGASATPGASAAAASSFGAVGGGIASGCGRGVIVVDSQLDAAGAAGVRGSAPPAVPAGSTAPLPPSAPLLPPPH